MGAGQFLPPAANLGAYNIDVLMQSAEGTAGSDFSFDVAATMAASPGYVFPSAANFFDAVNTDTPSLQRLTLTDFDLAGVDVVASANQHRPRPAP